MKQKVPPASVISQVVLRRLLRSFPPPSLVTLCFTCFPAAVAVLPHTSGAGPSSRCLLLPPLQHRWLHAGPALHPQRHRITQQNNKERLREFKATPRERFWSFSHANDGSPGVSLKDFVGVDRFIGAAYCVSAAGLLHFLQQQQQLHLHLLRLDLSATIAALNKNHHHHLSPKTSYRSRSSAVE